MKRLAIRQAIPERLEAVAAAVEAALAASVDRALVDRALVNPAPVDRAAVEALVEAETPARAAEAPDHPPAARLEKAVRAKSSKHEQKNRDALESASRFFYSRVKRVVDSCRRYLCFQFLDSVHPLSYPQLA
jgi:hypothetical protein